GLPMKKGRAGTMTHDYKRNSTTTLFAALNMLDGTVIGTCMPRHRHREFLRFLKLIDQQTPAGLDLHLIVDNYATHKTPAVKRWIKSHPRFHLHFTPTWASTRCERCRCRGTARCAPARRPNDPGSCLRSRACKTNDRRSSLAYHGTTLALSGSRTHSR